jgi:ABC-type multidrug transport system fused ATPase/permease subunit
MGSQHGMAMRAERGGSGRRGREDSSGASKKKPLRVMDQLPEIWALMRPHRGLLAFGLVLVAIKSACVVVFPKSLGILYDNVFKLHQYRLLNWLVGATLLATLIQGVASYTLTQTLSKAAQRMITELRRKVQEHVGRLPVAYYDSNKTGALVSRIMSDVEGVRNLIGTGLVEFLGGLLTAAIVLGFLLRISPLMTGRQHAWPA